MTDLEATGYSVHEGAFSGDEVAFFRDRLRARYEELGSPATYARPPLEPAPDVEISPVGLVFHRLGKHFPEFGSRLLKPSILACAEDALGEGMFFEYAGAVLCRGERPFFDWHAHMGGVDNVRYRKDAIFPRYQRSERVTGLLYLDDTDGPDASVLRLMPRRVTDATEPPFDPKEERWPGQVEVPCRKGTVVLLEQSTWHAASTKRDPGLRAFIAFYLTSPRAPSPSWVDTSFADGAAGAALPDSLFPRR